jgi:uncharacterized protein YcbX
MPSDANTHVTALATTPVKGMRLLPRDEIQLDWAGARDNRCFYLIDERGRMVNGKQLGELNTIVPDYDPDARRLTLRFADGAEISGIAERGPALQTSFFSRPAQASLVVGPWSDAVSAAVARDVRLVEAGTSRVGVDRGRSGGVSLISQASLGHLAGVADEARVDPRRFRMLIEVGGIAPYHEDTWVGRDVRVGDARVRFRGHVGRCLVTSRHPESGQIDLPTLGLLGSYRAAAGTTEPLAFGIYGEVVEPGAVRVGDPVTPA